MSCVVHHCATAEDPTTTTAAPTGPPPNKRTRPVRRAPCPHPAYLPAPSQDEWTPLLAACSNGHVQVVKTLLAVGADIEARSGTVGDVLEAVWGARVGAGCPRPSTLTAPPI